jgi:hypothetical protein
MGLSFHRIIVASLVLAAVALLPGREARADELFVMPYSCKVAAGGRLLLRPSEDQGHPVIGRRQQEDYRACSPANPGLCRRWNIHRFSLDCGGTRVPWIDVAAAIAAQEDGVDGTRAFVSGGHFELEMPPSWSLAPDDPCSRPGDADPWNGGVRRFCSDRLARTPPVTVTMPRGFAPMLGIDGIFVADSARGGTMAEAPRGAPGFDRVAPREGMAEAPWRGEEADGRRGPSPRATWNETERAPPPQREAAAPPLAPLPEKKPSPPAPKAPAIAETKPAAPKSQTAPTEAPVSRGTTLAAPAREEAAAPAPKSEAPSGGEAAVAERVVPTIINGTNGAQSGESAPGNAEKQNESRAAPSEATSESAPASLDAVSPSSSEVPAPAAATPLDPVSSEPVETTAFPVTFTGVLSHDNVLLYGVGGAALLSLLVLAAAFMRRGQRSNGVPLARDIASVSFDAAAPAKTAEPTLNALAVVPPPGARDVTPALDVPPGPPALVGDTIPRTREEALRVLGIGVTPDVNDAAIKKIIDGLRISWHPDHARDAEDRRVRELRVRQINVAWDILANRGAA